MSNRSLKENIDGISVLQFQIAYILDKTHPYNKTWLSCVMMCIICGGVTNNLSSKSAMIA